MNTTAVAVINGQQIQVSNDELQLVPIKPICQALGVAYHGQVNQIKSHPIFGSVVSLSDTTGADGKTYQMLCLPIEYVFGWIFTINPNNVNEGARETMIKYQKECNHALYEYFTKDMRRERELLQKENIHLIDLAEAKSQLVEYKDKVAQTKKRIGEIECCMAQIRELRHNPQPSLFD